ncbi:TPA: adenosylcobalamin/alpha-ribazole phosphatase [Yersinia enterocolitica]|uniref:adenosylcobalamin/alpha-ribazole phosphatase n=1 Tax=Yersinia enterocolitica TaxID=630 RepID=UPI001C8D3C6B|nr:adenosylcobalamin/alpha-ribazole phosphatase [Yersinia enterocolitica]MBX9489099.1 adenosylcobalamin/alpha-ribazole phosphatase [Yersinia enterocolitica]MBX9493264.1 adenosylcobalamin/alpha-ribazole phosphatase [Yersinia enterocolitica]HDL8052903.1 adenosylcobalamin/alpha-ribazole phosphatase [Yersinia enterocolitica]HEI6850974.1 adenosylcobalamin/alpha-ribazole phosphatase [Yersinia enterocolitica]HEN3605164.1 adenosylcobalamin/alpha-ribazole phosphatase [Yersinia enterocolitica]
MRLFLVRHGQTEANLRGVFCGLTDLALTPLGVEQAGDVASWLADVAFVDGVSSQLLRARHTADIVLAGHSLNAGINDQLNEMNFGEWEMRHHHDLQREDPDAWAAWVADWQQASPTGGESFIQFSDRVESVVQSLLSSNSHQTNRHQINNHDNNQLLVAHQGVLSLMLARLLAMPAAAMWHFHFEQGAYSVLEIHDGFVTLRAFNSRAAWQPAPRG